MMHFGLEATGDSTLEKAHPAVVLGRHAVGIFAAGVLAGWLGRTPWLPYGIVDSVLAGVVVMVFAAVAGVAAAGLLALFFTRSQTQTFTRNAVVVAWVVAAASVLGGALQGARLAG